MSKEIAVLEQTDVVVLDEDEVGGSGLQNVNETDQLVPRLQIAAGTSKQIMKGDEKHIPGLQVGEIFNTVTKEVYGDSVAVIPVWFSKNRILFDKDWKIECSSPDGVKGGKINPTCDGCEYSQWGSGANDVGFACTEFRNFAVLVVSEDGSSSLASVSFKGTSSGTAKTWINMIDARKAKTKDGVVTQLPMYRGLYTLTPSAKENTKKRAVFYVWSVNNAGNIDTSAVQGQALLAKAKIAYQRFQKAELRLTGEGDSE
jgi:hypothetical protein